MKLNIDSHLEKILTDFSRYFFERSPERLRELREIAKLEREAKDLKESRRDLLRELRERAKLEREVKDLKESRRDLLLASGELKPGIVGSCFSQKMLKKYIELIPQCGEKQARETLEINRADGLDSSFKKYE